MLRPLAMKHVVLQVLSDDLPQVSLTLAELEVFHPDCRECRVISRGRNAG